MQCALALAVVTVKAKKKKNLQWGKVIIDVVISVVCLLAVVERVCE